MLDHFLDVAIKHETDRSQSVKLASDLKRLPRETLYGLATGSLKLAFGHCENDDWLDKYKDTPLMSEAVALEKAELENEVARSQAQAASPQMDQFYRTTDQIRVQKKMLDLKLMEAMETQGLPMQPGGQLPEQITQTAQGAGALGDIAPEGAQDGAAGKMASAFQKAAFSITESGHKYDAESARMRERHGAEELERMQAVMEPGKDGKQPGLLRGIRYAISDPFGHAPATHDPRRAAYVARKHEEGVNALNPFGGTLTPSQYEVGGSALHIGHMKVHKDKHAEANFQKAALDLKALGEKALNWAKANPGKAGALAGGALGAGAGALSAEKGHRLGGALAGGVAGAGIGAGLGHAAGGIQARTAGGKGVGEAVKSYGNGVVDAAGKKMRDVADFFKKAPAAEPQQLAV